MVEPLVHELQQLEATGIDIQQFPDGRTVRVFGALSLLLNDHPQACFNCSHLGNNAVKNCRMCLVDKNDRLDFCSRVLEHHMTRRAAQSDLIRAQMDLELGSMPSTREVQEVRRKYGLTRLDPPFGGAADAHQQCVVCIGHCIDVGLLKLLLNCMLKNVKTTQRELFKARVRALELPRGWTPFGERLINFDGKFSQPMATVRKLAFFSDTLFGGLVPNELIDLTMGLVSLRAQIMKSGHTTESVAKVIDMTEISSSTLIFQFH